MALRCWASSARRSAAERQLHGAVPRGAVPCHNPAGRHIHVAAPLGAKAMLQPAGCGSHAADPQDVKILDTAPRGAKSIAQRR